MDPTSSFKFPQPLNELSPERVNRTRPVPTISTKSTALSSQYSDMEYQNPASPTRKANLFADYSPQKPSSSVSGFTLAQSPSLPEIHALRSHVRTNSDVQGLVKRFEHLDVRDKDAESSERRKRHEAELRRAQIAREEAESDVRRLREELRRLKKESDEDQERSREARKMVEVLRDDLTTAKDAQASQASIYEKELRKARKEAFKSSSAVLKLQEELKSTRNTLRITHSGFDLERQKVQRKEQERFEMEYQLIPLQEQLEKLQHKFRIVEEEREALKTTLKEEEVARIAAEGMIALPVSQDMDIDLLSSPRKPILPRKFYLEENKENLGTSPKKALESRHLAEELERETMRREHAEEMVDFLRMECAFRCCGCKTATSLGHRMALELDVELAAGVERIRAGMEGILTTPIEPTEPTDEMEIEVPAAVKIEAMEEIIEQATEEHPDARVLKAAMQDDLDIDRSNTFAAESPSPDDQLHEEEEHWLQITPARPAVRASSPITEREITMTGGTPTKAGTPTTERIIMAEGVGIEVPLEPETPTQYPQHQITPFRHQPSIRTVTTTTTVPMHFTPISRPLLAPVFDPEDVENIPPTSEASQGTKEGSDGGAVIDRAAALAAIEYRRGRAKSIANGQATPRKQMLEGVGVGGRRDISAPALGQKSTGGNAAKGPMTGSLRSRR